MFGAKKPATAQLLSLGTAEFPFNSRRWSRRKSLGAAQLRCWSRLKVERKIGQDSTRDEH